MLVVIIASLACLIGLTVHLLDSRNANRNRKRVVSELRRKRASGIKIKPPATNKPAQ